MEPVDITKSQLRYRMKRPPIGSSSSGLRRYVEMSASDYLLQGIVERLLNARVVILTLFVIVTSILAMTTQSLRIIVNDNDVLPQSHRYLQTMHRVEEIFGNYTTFVILVSSRDYFGHFEDPRNVTAQISTALAQMPGIVSRNLMSVSTHKTKDIDGSTGELVIRPFLGGADSDQGATLRLHDAIERNPIYQDLLVTPDGRSFGIFAEVKMDPNGYRPMLARVSNIVLPYRSDKIDIVVSGQPAFLAVAEEMSDRMAWLFPVALLVIALVHFEAFRSIQAMVLPLATGLIAV